MCGIFGVYNERNAAELTVIGLHGNQHRAIDYAGIVSSDGTYLYREAGSGIARQVFTKEALNRLHGKHALGHIRYPTVTDDEARDNSQPIVGTYAGKQIAIAHNGNLTNVDELQRLLPTSKLLTSMDTEYILRLLEARCTGDFDEDLKGVLQLLRGSFSLGILLPDRFIAVRDKSGNRPLSIGKLRGGYCISSETCVFPNVEAVPLQDVEAGTFVSIGMNGLRTVQYAVAAEQKCRFEGVYFSLPSSNTFNESATRFRFALGQALENCAPVIGGADIVTPVPDSANPIALGYGESGRSGRFFPVIIRNHYVGRTFIAATQLRRDAAVAQKFGFCAEEIRGKRIVVVDDSIVRGTTMPTIVAMLRQLGASAVHVRIGCPPIAHPCRYGINTPTRKELIAANMTHADMCHHIGADTLEFLPLEVLQSLSPHPEKWCFACMNGKYWD